MTVRVGGCRVPLWAALAGLVAATVVALPLAEVVAGTSGAGAVAIVTLAVLWSIAGRVDHEGGGSA